MNVQHCTLGYRRASASALETFANGVYNGIYSNNIVFTTPPMEKGDFIIIKNTYSVALSDYDTYGITKKVAFVEAQQSLVNTLDSLALYVDSVALGNESTIALAGYVPSASVAQKSQPLDKIVFFTVKRTDTIGQVVVETPAITNRGDVSYFCVCVEGAPLTYPSLVNGQIKISPDDLGVMQDSNRTRRKIFNGLKPGVVYYFYFYAINRVSVSPLSDAKSIMAA